jgi:hypothetical protein
MAAPRAGLRPQAAPAGRVGARQARCSACGAAPARAPGAHLLDSTCTVRSASTALTAKHTECSEEAWLIMITLTPASLPGGRGAGGSVLVCWDGERGLACVWRGDWWSGVCVGGGGGPGRGGVVVAHTAPFKLQRRHSPSALPLRHQAPSTQQAAEASGPGAATVPPRPPDGREDGRRDTGHAHHARALHVDQRHVVDGGKALDGRGCAAGRHVVDGADLSAWGAGAGAGMGAVPPGACIGQAAAAAAAAAARGGIAR